MNYLKNSMKRFKQNIKKYYSKDNLIYQTIHKNRNFIIFLITLSFIASFSELIFLNNLPKLLDGLFTKINLDKLFLSKMLISVSLWSFLGIFVRYKIVGLMAILAKDLTEILIINFSNLSISEIEKIGKTKISVLSTINLDKIIYGVLNPLMRLVEQLLAIVVGIYVIYLNFGKLSIIFLIFAFLLVIILVLSTRNKAYEYGLVEVKKNNSVFYMLNLFVGNIREILLQLNFLYYSNPISKGNYQKINATGKQRFLSELPRRIVEAILYFSICFIAIFGLLNSSEIINNLASLSVALLILQRIAPLVQQVYNQIFSIFSNLPVISEYQILNSYNLYSQKIRSNIIYSKNYNEKRKIKSIQLRNLSIGHTFEKPLLFIPSLDFDINDSIAIVGPSGLGKSTLVETIIGLRLPLSGSYDYFDNEGSVVKNFKSISYIPQNSEVAGRSMFEMLSFGNPILKSYVLQSLCHMLN